MLFSRKNTLERIEPEACREAGADLGFVRPQRGLESSAHVSGGASRAWPPHP